MKMCMGGGGKKGFKPYGGLDVRHRSCSVDLDIGVSRKIYSLQTGWHQ